MNEFQVMHHFYILV